MRQVWAGLFLSAVVLVSACGTPGAIEAATGAGAQPACPIVPASFSFAWSGPPASAFRLAAYNAGSDPTANFKVCAAFKGGVAYSVGLGITKDKWRFGCEFDDKTLVTKPTSKFAGIQFASLNESHERYLCFNSRGTAHGTVGVTFPREKPVQPNPTPRQLKRLVLDVLEAAGQH